MTVCLDIVNGTDDLLYFSSIQASINGKICDVNRFTDQIKVLPHSILPTFVTIQAEVQDADSPDNELFHNLTGLEFADFREGDLIRTLSLSLSTLTRFNVSGTFTVTREAPLGMERGVFIPGSASNRKPLIPLVCC